MSVNIFTKFNPNESKFLGIDKGNTGKGIKVATLEAVGTSDVIPFKIKSPHLVGGKHSKWTALTLLSVAPDVELHSLSGGLSDNIDYIISEGIKVVFASLNDVTVSVDKLERLHNNGVILIKSSGNTDGKPVGEATRSPYWITVSSVGISNGKIYHSPFSKEHEYIDFASFGAISLPDIPDDFDFPKRFTGTSFSTPVLAGMIALILESNPNLSHKDIYKILLDNADRYGLKKNQVGNGVVTYPSDLTKPEDPIEEVIDMFKDLDKDRYSTEHIEALAELGIITGYTDGTFKPQEPVTREQVVTMLNKLRLYLENK